jgi:hypothetical protein
VKPFKIVPDRSKTNIFVSYCEEEEKRKKTKLRFFNKAKKNEYNCSSTIEDLPLLVGIELLETTTRGIMVSVWEYAKGKYDAGD